MLPCALLCQCKQKNLKNLILFISEFSLRKKKCIFFLPGRSIVNTFVYYGVL